MINFKEFLQEAIEQNINNNNIYLNPTRKEMNILWNLLQETEEAFLRFIIDGADNLRIWIGMPSHSRVHSMDSKNIIHGYLNKKRKVILGRSYTSEIEERIKYTFLKIPFKVGMWK